MDDETEILRSQSLGEPVGYGEVLVDMTEDYKLLGVIDNE